MGRKPKKKDIAEYLWHSEPTKINATNDNWRIRYGYLDSEGKEHQTTETVNNERAKNQFVSYLLLREKEHKAAKGTTVASKVDKTEIETVEQLLYAYAEHTKYLHTIFHLLYDLLLQSAHTFLLCCRAKTSTLWA